MLGPTALPRTLEAALRDVRAPKVQARAGAVRDLVRHASEAREQVVPAVERALRDDDARVRSEAAIALADLKACESLAALLVAVEDESPHVRQMAILALGEIGDPRATERLRRALSDKRPEVRFQAVMAFPRVCGDRSGAIDALVHATRDEDPLVCHIAVRMAEELGGGGPGQAVAPEELLVRARDLLGHASPRVRVIAAIVLARSGRSGAEEVLAAVALGELGDLDAEDEAAAVELCGVLDIEAARRGLERRAFGGFLGFRRDRFAWHARVALARMGHERATREILNELTAWDRGRRTLAVAAAGQARIVAARPILQSMRGDHERADPDAIDDALHALDQAEAR